MEIFIALILMVFFGLFIVLSLPISKEDVSRLDRAKTQEMRRG